MGVLDRSNVAPESCDCNAKKINALQCTVAEKIMKNPKNRNLAKNDHSNCILQGVEDLTLQSVRPVASFDPSNTPIK